MVVNEAAARRNHVGRVTDSEENFSVYSQATLDAEDKAFVMKIQDTVRAAVEEAAVFADRRQNAGGKSRTDGHP